MLQNKVQNVQNVFRTWTSVQSEIPNFTNFTRENQSVAEWRVHIRSPIHVHSKGKGLKLHKKCQIMYIESWLYNPDLLYGTTDDYVLK